MLGYFEVFPEKCDTELRVVRFLADDSPIPPGQYAFSEYYCSDLSCNCRSVLVKVLLFHDPESMPDDIAALGYTWDETLSDEWERALGNPCLELFHPQAEYAEDLLEFWYEMLCEDQDYADRLKRHYEELRRACRERDESGPLGFRGGARKIAHDRKR